MFRDDLCFMNKFYEAWQVTWKKFHADLQKVQEKYPSDTHAEEMGGEIYCYRINLAAYQSRK